jgi:hypothetical protein
MTAVAVAEIAVMIPAVGVVETIRVAEIAETAAAAAVIEAAIDASAATVRHRYVA